MHIISFTFQTARFVLFLNYYFYIQLSDDGIAAILLQFSDTLVVLFSKGEIL